MGQLSLQSQRSKGPFAGFYELLAKMEIDNQLIKEADAIDGKDLIIDEKPHNFLALLHEFLPKAEENKKMENLIADD